MYSGENSGIDLKDIIVKILFLVFFVLILLWLYPKMPDLSILTDRVYNENITSMKDAAVDYYTVDRLPKNDSDISEMTLQKMLDLKLLVPFVDKDGNSCDTTNSYVQVTKNGSEYILKTVLVCGKQNDYIVEYIGCHDVCEKDECKVTTKEETKKPTSTNNNSNGGSSSTVKPSTPSTPSTTTTKYTIKFKAENGTVGTSSVKVVKGKNTSTTAKPKTGYEYGSVSCTNGQKASYSGTTLKVTNVTKSATCTVKFVKKAEEVKNYTVKVAVVNGNSDVPSKTVVLNGQTTFKLTANAGYNANNASVTCSKTVTGVVGGSLLTVKDVKDNGTCVVTIGKTSYTNHTIKFSVVNGKSSVTSKTVAPGSTIMTTITPNAGHTIKGATVSCGKGLNYTLDGYTLAVKNIKASGNCMVVLKEANVTHLNVVKTYYSTGYVSKTGTYSYTINLETLPSNVTPAKVTAVGVSIKPMSSYSDFSNYIAAKKAEEMTMVNGSGEYSVKYNTAATLQAHALTSSNFTTSATAGCTKSRCQVYITNSVKNLNGVTPTGEVELGNGSKVSGLYYVPVKFIVTFKYEK